MPKGSLPGTDGRHKPFAPRYDRLARSAKANRFGKKDDDAGPSEDDIDDYRFLFGSLDPQTMEPMPYSESGDRSATLRETMEWFKVKPEKLGGYVPFKLRPVQAYIHNLKLACWRLGKPAKIIVLKTRRYGATTAELIESVVLMMRHPGWIGSTIAKDDEDAGKFFRIVRETVNQVPKWALKVLGLELVSMTRKHIAFRHLQSDGGFMESSISIFSANSSTGIGRGATNNKLHPTEPPHYKNRAKEDYSAIQPSMGDFAGNCEVWESTAKGNDAMFQPQWDDAHWPEEPRKESEFQRVFIPAYAHPNFYRPFENDEERAALEKSMGTLDRFGGKQERWYFETLLIPYQTDGDIPEDALGTDLDDRSPEAARLRALEQINYMRMLVVDKCKPEGFPRRCQEYPMTPEEAFQSTGSPFFNIAKVRAWLPHARLDHRSSRTKRGRFTSDGKTVNWAPDPNGIWLMREDREELTSYHWGGDTASGATKHASGKQEGDYSTCVVGELFTGRHVCVLRAHLRPKAHAYEIAKASFYYGKARGYAERAVTGDAGTMITRLEQIEIGDWCAVDSLLKSVKMIWSDEGQVEEKVLGFNTRLGTKMNLCEGASDFFDEEVGDPVEGQRCLIDYLTLQEMDNFERVSKTSENGTTRVSLKASRGHDDMVMTMALRQLARTVLLDETTLQTQVEPQMDPEVAVWQARWDSQATEEEEVYL